MLGVLLFGWHQAMQAQTEAATASVAWAGSPLVYLLVLIVLVLALTALIVEWLRHLRKQERRPQRVTTDVRAESPPAVTTNGSQASVSKQVGWPSHRAPAPAQATAQLAPPIRRPGLPRLGRFQLELEIGRGAMGRVYRGIDTSSGQPVAIKTLALTREFTGYALTEARERFQREAQAARRLSHPDIVQVFDAGEEQGLAYIAMELLHGSDLTPYTRTQDRMAVDDVLIIGTRVALALAHAHAQGVVHRDIKPANVMVDFAHDRVKVMDFGIARISDAARTRTGLVLGSPLYMSPEQLMGRPVDGRSDLYSLGLVLFQLLCGRLPNEAGSMAELMRAAVDQAAPSVRDLRPELPQVLADVIALALQKRVELRYVDGHEMARDLTMIATRHSTAPTDGRSATVHEVAQSQQGSVGNAGGRSSFVHNDRA
jgi:serine/threonine-protein kinase